MQWEHKALFVRVPEPDELTLLGAAGWELVGVLQFEDVPRTWVMYFKRPVRSQSAVPQD